jgi:hypothetical protein
MGVREGVGDPRARREELWSLLGDLPEAVTPTSSPVGTFEVDGGTVERLVLDVGGPEPVPALLALPSVREEHAHGMLYIHAHNGDQGKDELLEGRPRHQGPYLPALLDRGIVTLCIDNWCFGERRGAVPRVGGGGRDELDTFKRMLWDGRVLFGMMVFDQVQAFRYLASRPEVDAGRVGTTGLSMGSTLSWWVAALEERVRVCVDLCCLTDFEELIRTDGLAGHGIYYYVPRLLRHFSSAEINALIAPRPRLSLNGEHDPLTPPAGVRRIAAEVGAAYASLGAPDRCRIELFDCGHEETPEMRRLALEWIDRHV